jgi:hypothetical protein
MAIVPLPLSPNAAARALLHHLVEHGDIVGRDTTGRTIIQLAVDDRVLETLMIFDADAADLEPEPDEEEDGSPVVVELVPAEARGAEAGHTFRPGRLGPWHAGRRSSSRCTASSYRASPWTTRTSSA